MAPIVQDPAGQLPDVRRNQDVITVLQQSAHSLKQAAVMGNLQKLAVLRLYSILLDTQSYQIQDL